MTVVVYSALRITLSYRIFYRLLYYNTYFSFKLAEQNKLNNILLSFTFLLSFFFHSFDNGVLLAFGHQIEKKPRSRWAVEIFEL